MMALDTRRPERRNKRYTIACDDSISMFAQLYSPTARMLRCTLPESDDPHSLWTRMMNREKTPIHQPDSLFIEDLPLEFTSHVLAWCRSVREWSLGTHWGIPLDIEQSLLPAFLDLLQQEWEAATWVDAMIFFYLARLGSLDVCIQWKEEIRESVSDTCFHDMVDLLHTRKADGYFTLHEIYVMCTRFDMYNRWCLLRSSILSTSYVWTKARGWILCFQAHFHRPWVLAFNARMRLSHTTLVQPFIREDVGMFAYNLATLEFPPCYLSSRFYLAYTQQIGKNEEVTPMQSLAFLSRYPPLVWKAMDWTYTSAEKKAWKAMVDAGLTLTVEEAVDVCLSFL